jgi:AraC-like DNA-binding protein
MLISELALQLSISQAAFLGVASFLFQRDSYVGKLLIAFAVCMLAYFYRFYLDVSTEPVLAYILGRLSYGIPAIIWLLAFALFGPEKRIPVYVWISIATYFLLRTIGVAYFPLGYDAPFETPANLPVYVLFYIVPQIINTGMYIHTLVLAVFEYQQDLIEARRRLRVYFVAVLGSFWLLVSIQVSVSVIIRMGWGGDHFGVVYNLANSSLSILIFPVVFAVNLMLFRMKSLDSDGSKSLSSSYFIPNLKPEVIDPKDLQLKDMLLGAMVEDKLYRQNGLTIVSLAKQKGAQEYKLRSVINRVLGYNNFSCFLNKYRIKEAEERLVGTSDSIFNIGLDVGYTSLSSFHKAFKEAHGITPKEFRILSRHSETLSHNGNAQPVTAEKKITLAGDSA